MKLTKKETDYLVEQTTPKNIVKYIDDFEAWLKVGNPTIKTLEMTLKKFEDDEMYEHCALILKEINNLKSKL